MPRIPKFNVGKEKLTAQCEACEAPVTPVPLKVRICVFFDGTNNNKYNVNTGKRDRSLGLPVVSESSYDADLSNVARLSNAFQFYRKKYEIQFAIYVVGAGTGGDIQDATVWGKGISNQGKEDGDNRQNDYGETADSEVLGGAFAVFRTGIIDRAKLAVSTTIFEIDRRIKVFRAKKNLPTTAPVAIESVEFDAFGFSRGAATARHFVYRILNIDRFYLGYANELRTLPHVQSVGRVKFVFLGLYDTVASHGLVHVNDVRSLRLDWMNRVDRVVHLCASDEHRTNFALTNIRSAGSKGVEIFLPGVHSDVGGGYLDYRGDLDTWLFYKPVLYKYLVRPAGRRLIRPAGRRLALTYRCVGGAGHTWTEYADYPIDAKPKQSSVCPQGITSPLIGYSVQASWNDEYEEWPDEWKEYNSWVNENQSKYDAEQNWLEQSGWFKGNIRRVEVVKTSTQPHFIAIQGMVSTRGFLSNRYSWITLQLMADYASDSRWFLKFNRRSIYGIYSLAKEPFLRNVQLQLQNYIAQRCGPIPTSTGVGRSNLQDWFSHPVPCDKVSQFPWLPELRRVYGHFSARYQDGINFVLGVHAPQYNGESRMRRIFDG